MARFTALIALVVAATARAAIVLPRDQCNTGSISCCNSLTSHKDESALALLGLLGIPLGETTSQIGIQCSPIPTLDILAGNACTSTPVCCENSSHGGLVNVGCLPIVL